MSDRIKMEKGWHLISKSSKVNFTVTSSYYVKNIYIIPYAQGQKFDWCM